MQKIFAKFDVFPQIRSIFLQWLPWFLRMARPGEKITRKTIMMQNKMKELDLKERSSKSLLANVLDMDDDFRPSSTLPGHPPMGMVGPPGVGGPPPPPHPAHVVAAQGSTVIGNSNPPFARYPF